jgi:transglutaminase-like putative cysteine protease
MHYVRTYHGRVIGVRRVTVREEGECVRTETLDRTRISTRGVTVLTVTEKVEFADLDGHGMELRERQTEGPAAEALLRRGGAPFEFTPRPSRGSQIVETKVTVAEGEVVFHTTVAGITRPARTTTEGAVRFDLDGSAFLRKRGLEVGRTVLAFVAARVELGIAELEARVVERVALPEIEGVYAGGEEGFRIRISNVGGRGEPWEIVCDARGRTVELRVGPQTVRRVAAADAVLPRKAPVLSNTFPTRRLMRLEGVRSMTVEATVASDAGADVFPTSVYCSATSDGDGKRRLSLSEARPDGRLPREELSAEDRARFLAPSRLVESDAPEIVSLALRIVGGDAEAFERDYARAVRAARGELGPDETAPGPLRARGGEKEPLKRTLFLTRWVYRNLRKRSRGAATASALEALRSGGGDCTEHAALVTALARAAGLPARQAFGLVQDGEGFQFHAWAEVHAGDRWVPVDPTLGRVGVPALYILLGREGDVVEYHSRANALQGRTSMRLVEVN